MSERIFLKVNDLMILTGTSERNCRRLMMKLRNQLQKKQRPNGRYHEITIEDYCKLEDLPHDKIREKLKLRS